MPLWEVSKPWGLCPPRGRSAAAAMADTSLRGSGAARPAASPPAAPGHRHGLRGDRSPPPGPPRPSAAGRVAAPAQAAAVPPARPHYISRRAGRGGAGPGRAERSKAGGPGAGTARGGEGRAGQVGRPAGVIPMERGKMAELESLETAAEHERILREIESTDTACIGPTLRCGRGGAAGTAGAGGLGQASPCHLPSPQTLKQ